MSVWLCECALPLLTVILIVVNESQPQEALVTEPEIVYSVLTVICMWRNKQTYFTYSTLEVRQKNTANIVTYTNPVFNK